VEEHPIYAFAKKYNPSLGDAEIKAKYIDNGKYLETMSWMREEMYPDMDQDAFLTKFHTKYPDLSKKKEPTVSGASTSAGINYTWDSGRPRLEDLSSAGPQTSLTGASSGTRTDLSKRAAQETALAKARQRPNFEKAADLDEYTKQQVQESILAPEKEYQTRLNTLQSDSDNLQRAIEATEDRIKEKWGENWMSDYNSRVQSLNDPNARNEELVRQQQEFEADQFINERNKFITALEANHESGKQILKDDKYAYARALEEYDKKKLQKAEHEGWGNLTLGILQRSAGKLIGSVGEAMNIGENLVTQDKKYTTWDKVEDFFIDFQNQTDKVAPRPTKYTRPLYTKTAKTTLNGEQVEVDYVDDKPSVVRNKKGMVIEADPNQFKDLKPKNQYNSKGLLYQTGEVLADAMAQIATTKGIGGTLVKTGMSAKVAYATGVTASTMGQMAGGLYDKGLEMFDGDKRKAAQYATMTGLAIGVGSNLFGLEARLAGGPALNLSMVQAVKGLTPKAAAAQTAKAIIKEGAGEAFEETILENAIQATTAMMLNGDAEDIDLNEMKGTALISFVTGALMGGGSNDFKNSAWLVAAENPEEFKKALQAEVANGKKIDVDKMYQKALKIKGLSEIKEVREEDIPKLDELTDLKDKAEKAKTIGADAQAKIFKEQAAAKEVEVLKESEISDEVVAKNLPAEVENPVQETVNQETGENLANKQESPARQAFESSVDQSISDTITQEQVDALKTTTEANAQNWAKRTGKTVDEFYEKFKPTVSRETTQIPDDALKQIVGEKASIPEARKGLEIAKKAVRLDPKMVYLATGWEKVDGKWKYDLPDVEVQPLSEGSYKLGDVATGGIIDAYPNAKDIEVVIDPNLKSIGLRKGNKISLRSFDKPTLIHELQHWVQQEEGFAGGASLDSVSGGVASKLTQSKDELLKDNPNLAKVLNGGKAELSVNDIEVLVKNKETLSGYAAAMEGIYKKYKSVVGEVEARNAADRSKMSPAERRVTPISETEDTKDKIYLDRSGVEKSIAEDILNDKEITKPLSKPEFVPTSDIEKYVEADRSSDARTSENVGKLAAQIERDGGIKEPVVLTVFKDKKAVITEGNHRVAAAKQLGIANVPVRVEFSNKKSTETGYKETAKQLPETMDFEVKSDMNKKYPDHPAPTAINSPSSIGFKNAKPLTLFQQQSGETLGAFSTIDGAASAWLFDNATVETLFHEIDPTTGHFGHAVMYDILDNALPEYKAQAEADVKTIEEFLGASDRNWTREQHEKFVAAGEKYLREGVAPTPELRPVFERLKQWLTDIFNSVKDRADIEITPELRQVFDRSLGRTVNGKLNTTMAAESFKDKDEDVVVNNGFFGFKPKASFIRAIKKLWNYTFYRDGNLPELASKLAQKRLGKIREQIKKATLSSERLRPMLKGKSEAQIQDINAALQNPSLGKASLYYSDGTNIEEGILNELVEMRMHVDSLSSTLITEGISTGESAMTILNNLQFYITQDLQVDFNQDWNRLNSFADSKLGRLEEKINDSEGAEQVEFKIEKLKTQAKKIQFYTANIEKAVRAEEDVLRKAGKLPANQSPRRKDIGKAYETGVYKYSDGTDIEPGIVRDLKAMKELSKEIEAGISDLKLIGTINMADMPMYLTRSYQVHWDKDWFDKVQSTEAFTNAVRFFREQKENEKDDLVKLVKLYREKLNSTNPGTSMVPSVENNQGVTSSSEFYREKLRKAELDLAEIDLFDPVAEAKACLFTQSDKSGSFSSSASLGSRSAGSFAKRKLIPDEIRALWGESKDPVLNYMTSVYKIAHILENRRFIREVVKQGDFIHPFPVGDFIAKFPTTADELSDYYSTPEIVEAFKIYNQSITQSDPTNMFHRAVDALSYLSGVVKKNLTVFSISSAARNFFYNPFAMIQRGAWNPLSKNVGDAIEYFRKGTEKETLEFYRLGILGDDLISGPLAEIRRDYQKRTGDPIIPGPVGEKWIPRLAEKMKSITKGLETAYAFGDNFYKVIDFYRQREKLSKLYKNKKYEDLLVSEQEEIKEMAAERILSEHASYSTLPRGMRILAKQPFIAPFAPFPYEMIRNTKNMIVNQIKDMRDGGDFKENGLSTKQTEFLKTMLGQAFVFGGVPIIGGLIRTAMSGMSDDDEEKLRYFLPVYHENSYIIPISNDKGKVYYMDISGVLPQGHMLSTLNNLSDGRFGPIERADNALAKFMQPFTSVDPLTKSMAESFLGYQVDSPERKISIYGEEDWLKTRAWNIAGKKGPGTLNSLMRIHEAATNPRTDLIVSNEVASFGLGIRLYNVDVVNNFGFAALEVAAKLKDTFGEYDRMIRSKAFGKLSPKEQEVEKKRTIERETKDYYRFTNEFRRVYLAAKTFPGIEEREVDAKMQSLGLDRYVVKGIMSGDIKEPRFGK